MIFVLPTGGGGYSRVWAFVLSLCAHAVGIVLLVSASRAGWLEPAPKPVRRQIAFRERVVLWYTPPRDLPAVTPLAPLPARSGGSLEFHPRQRIAASAPNPESRRQMVLSPPRLRLEQDQLLPNVVAWSPAKPAEPPEPKPRFQPSERRLPAPPPRALDSAAPQFAAAAPGAPAPVHIEAPQLPARPGFQMPGSRSAPASGPAVLSGQAPQVPGAPSSTTALARLEPKPSMPLPGFVAPHRPVPSAGARAATTTEAPPGTVIVGLDPAPAAPIPELLGNRLAEFSAEPHATGGKGSGSIIPTAATVAQVRVPNLSIGPAAAPALTRPPSPIPGDRSDFRRQLAASLPRDGASSPASLTPDIALRGSTVYAMAVDMPNITSYDGSWTVRFTELGGSSPDDTLTAPFATRKVDPKYIASAAADGIEGKVLLYAVIRRTGRVDQVRLVQGIDERLDSSAVAAFSKWEFQPATKNGFPVDLEAVVQIPFRLGKTASR